MIICYFGALRERLGVKSEEFTDISECQTAGDIIKRLSAHSERHAQAFAAFNNICVAIDQEHADLSSPIDGAQEVAFFPPVTGG
jgi:Molybdopterin converting factor, small subunit